MSVQVLEINLPEYILTDEMPYDLLGRKIDDLLQSSLPDGTYAERTIGLVDHPGKSLEELTEIILRTGTDKYDPNRESIFDEEFSPFEFDIHASEFEIRNQQLLIERNHDLDTYFGQNIYCFHKLTLIDRGYSIRLGISLLYDASALLPAIQLKECDDWTMRFSKFLYRFDGNPVDALRAILIIR